MAPAPSVYFILGTPGSGRRVIVCDLLENGLEGGEAATVLLASSEAEAQADAALAARPGTTVARWTWNAPGFTTPDVTPAETLFMLSDPMVSPVDQLEALKPWLIERGLSLARIICIVDCGLAEREPALRGWFEAGIHFSDVVLLTRRDGVANKWMSDFINHFKKLAFPCHFIQLRKTGIENPALVLDPTPRRVSQYFDDEEDVPEVAVETDDEEGDEEDDDTAAPEPYFERLRGGRRTKDVPELRKHLPAR